MNKFDKIVLIAVISVFISSCRKDREPVIKEFVPTAQGFYLLNEGNWGSNKSSLDYFDFETGDYRKNIFGDTNPDITLGLGDVGNDIKIYGSKLYIVVNGSNKVEVLDLNTLKRVGKADINNCRYITFYKSKAYVSSYDGLVAVIDTANVNHVQKTIAVGRQPEEMAVVGTKLYVANSGGYRTPPENDYDRTVSVIDLNTETEIKKIDVAINLHRLKADKYGDIYVTSRGNYEGISSSLYVIDTQTDEVKNLNVPVTNFYIHEDEAYLFSYSEVSNSATYRKLNVKTETLLSGSFIKDGTETGITIPYGIAVNPLSGDIYITDAKDYVNPGNLNIYNKEGYKIRTIETGDIPACFAFFNNK